MLEQMLDAIRNAGLQGYLAGQKDGRCTAPYIVVADAGITRTGKTTGLRTYYATACVPIGAPLRMADTLGRAKAALAGVPGLRDTGEVSPEEIDDEVMCRWSSAEYQVMVSLI